VIILTYYFSPMTGFTDNIETKTLNNDYFRQVIYTAAHMQLVIMSLKPSEEIGLEVHKDSDQFFRFEGGSGKVVINGEETNVKDGDIAIVPAGTEHNIINTSETENLKLYTIYAPAQHPDGTIHKTKAEAIVAENEE
jgi:mannose-6-phosphate isomerase-like protein (cupin superfamily)